MVKSKIYNRFHIVSAILMMIALVWLTISVPFILENQKRLAQVSKISLVQSPLAGSEEESGNPIGNNNGTEEKAPKTLNTFSEEYLHDHHKSDHLFSLALQYHKHENAGIYIAYHGEPLVPPPNVA
ncbi:MAG TPA: hypothetical protein VNM35_03735 [Chitinophagaceae bacterium]|jgi:hypothetical protein|nr:hypothetical protein [Chitinophagaceae bacterium]